MVLKKLGKTVKLLASKTFKKNNSKRNPYKPLPLPLFSFPPSPSPSDSSTMESAKRGPFQFPQVQSSVLPDPSPFFSHDLLSSPLPTNSFFQNFVLNRGDQAEYIHPYLIKSSKSSLSLCYPSQFSNPAFIYQIYNEDLTITASNNPNPNANHVVSSFNDLSVTLEFPSSNLKFFLVRGSPYLTAIANGVTFSLSTIHAILEFSPNKSRTKYTIKLNNNQTWLLYASSPIDFTQSNSSITSNTSFTGVIRIANLPDQNPDYESTLDRFSSCYPISGEAVLAGPFSLQYKWEKKGWGDLLMLANSHHLQLLSGNDSNVTVLDDFKYKSIDGELVGIVGDSWEMKTRPVSITWHSIRGINEDAFPEIIAALVKDVGDLDPTTIATTSSYFYGKLIARAARLVLIAEEVDYPDVLPAIKKFLKATVEPWLNGTFAANGFLYDSKWGGLVTKQSSTDPGGDFGFGLYNDHHYHLGHFLYAIAVLTKIDPAWGRRYKPQAYSLMADFMTLGKNSKSKSMYPRLRNFDLWKLHSWAGGVTEFADGRNQESTSEAVNAYYSAALLGLAYGDTHLVALGSMLSALEIQSAQTWWHVREEDSLYTEEFTKENRIMGVLWNNKRDSGLWFAPKEWRECRLGIQLLPILPISEILFSDPKYAKQLVSWTEPALAREGVGEGWKGFAYAIEGIYDKESALEKIRGLKGYDDGNSLSNLLWWIHSRGEEKEIWEIHRDFKLCWFGHYCH